MRKNKSTDQILPNDHEFDGAYRSTYYVSGWDFSMSKRYEIKKYCTKCNVTWETYRNLGKEGAVEYWEAEAKQYENRAKRGERHAKKMYKSYNKTAARASLITECDKVRMFGWYNKPTANE